MSVLLPNGRKLSNPWALAPMTNKQSLPDGRLGDAELRWLLRRAQGGFGLVSTCAAYVSEEGKAWEGQLGVANEAHLPGLRQLAEALRSTGTFSVLQLYHGGLQASLAPQRLAPAAVDGARAATAEDLARVVQDFVSAAERAAEAGFDGVEIHGANGYLFTQFLAPLDNPRTDDWGGPLSGRARLLRTTLRAVRAAVGERVAVGVRLSPVDVWFRRGLVLDDGVLVASWMAEDGADWVHLSLGHAWAPPPHEPGAPVVTRAVRDSLPARVPVFAAGRVWNAQDAAEARAAGADVVAVAKAAIGEPDWAARLAEPGFDPIRPPFTREHLASVQVAPVFADYLAGFPGMVEGGAPRRPR